MDHRTRLIPTQREAKHPQGKGGQQQQQQQIGQPKGEDAPIMDARTGKAAQEEKPENNKPISKGERDQLKK